MLQRQSEAIKKIEDAMDEATASKKQKEIESSQRKTIDNMIEMHSKIIDRSAAYTNLMLIGGYAGIFTIWSGTRTNLPTKANIAIAFSIGTSLAIFIGFEIYKMIITALRVSKISAFLKDSVSPDQFTTHLEEFRREEAKAPVGWWGIWIATITISVSTTLAALGLLAYNFLAVLVGFSQWPK